MLLDPPTDSPPTESPGLFARFGEEVANIIPETGSDVQDLLFSAGFRTPEEKKPEPVKPFFDIPAPKTVPEQLTDVAAGITKALPFIAAGEAGGAKVAEAATLGPRMTKVVKVASGFGLQGAMESPKQGVEDATLGAAFGAMEDLPLRAKLIAAPIIGLGTGLEAYRNTGSTTAAVVQGTVNAAIPFALKGRRVEDVDSEPAKNFMGGAPPKQSITGSIETPTLFKSAEESAAVMTGEIPQTLPDAPASSAIQKANLTEHYRSLETPTPEKTEVATLQTEKTPLDQPVVIDGKTLSFKEDVDAALDQALSTRKETATQTTRDLTINPSRQLKLTTVLHPDDSEMIQKAANKYDLEFTGVHGDGKQLLFTNPKADNPTTFSVPVGSTLKDLKNRQAEVEKTPTIATLQKPSQLPLKENIPPSSLESPAKVPGTFEVGARVMHDFGDGPELSIVRKSQEGSNVIQSAISGEFREGVSDSKLQPVPASKIASLMDTGFTSNTAEQQFVGDARNLAQIERDNVNKGMKLGRKQIDSGGVDIRLLYPIAKYSGAALGGAVVGARASDPDKRMQGAFMGAIAGMAAVRFGPRIFKLLSEAHPEVGKAGSAAEKVGKVVDAIREDAIKTGRSVIGDRALAREAVQSGNATGFEKVARWVQQRYSMEPRLKRVMQKAQGETEALGSVIHDSVKSLIANPELMAAPDKLQTIGDYFKGKATFDQMVKNVADQNVSNTVSAAKEAVVSLQKIIAKGLPDGALKTTIENSFGEYLTTSYKIFHDPKYFPPSEVIEKAAATLSDKLGSLEVRAKMIDSYLREIKVNQALYSRGLKGYGEKFTSLLSREQEPSQAFKEMLGKYDNPIQELAVTGLKITNAGRTAEMFDLLSKDIKSNGLKSVYSSHEWDATKESIRAKLSNATGSEKFNLKGQLDDLDHYVWNDFNTGHGLLSGKMIDYRMKEGLATYDSVFTQFRSPLAQQMANITNLVKYGHTVLSPFQFVRQVFSLPMLGIMGKTTPVDWWKAFATLQNKSPEGLAEISRLKKLGIFYGDVIGGMFHQDMQAMVGGKLDALLHDKIRSGLHTWEQVYRMPDLITRISAFQKEEGRLLESGVGAKEAENRGIDYANRYAINYGAVPKGIQIARQIPLVNQYLTFAYEVARITGNHFQDAIRDKNPYSIALLTSMATAPMIVEKLSEQANLSSQDRDDWHQARDLGPDYSRSNFRWVHGRDANGRFRYTDLTPIIVYDRWIKTIRDMVGGDASAALADNPVFGWENTPLLNVATNQISGMDIHTKEDFTPADISLSQNITDRFNSLRKDLFPQIIGGVELDRIVRSFTPNSEEGLGTTNERTGSTDNPVDLALMYMTGTRQYTVDLSYLQQRTVNDFQNLSSQLQTKLTRILSTNVSDQTKQQATDLFVERQKNLILSLQKKLHLESQPNS